MSIVNELDTQTEVFLPAVQLAMGIYSPSSWWFEKSIEIFAKDSTVFVNDQ